MTSVAPALRKSPTGIPGLDEITDGGLPAGRPTLVCGGPGSGKTLLGITFLVNGARAVRRARRPDELRGERGGAGARTSRRSASTFRGSSSGDAWSSTTSTSSAARSRKRASTTSKGCSCASTMPSGRSAPSAWCSTRSSRCSAGCRTKPSCAPSCAGCSAGCAIGTSRSSITGERGETTLTRHGLEEYVTDAVIQLDHRVHEQISTRRIRVVKYRGSHHGTNEYPFLIDADGRQRAAGDLAHAAARGVVGARLERARRSSTRCWAARATFAAARCWSPARPAPARRLWRRISPTPPAGAGERCLYFLFEESPQQMIRNMRSAGIDLRAMGRRAGCCSSTPTGRRGSGSRRTSSSCIAPSSSSGRTSSSSIR